MKKLPFLLYFTFCIFILSLPKDAFAQNVGIGTTTPEGLLHVKGTNWTKAILENNTGDPRGYFGIDNNGTITIGANAYWNGSAWIYPNTGSSLYMLFHRLNHRYEFRVRPDGGSQATAMTIDTGSNVTIGGNLVIDQENGNTGAINTNSLRFGSSSGEGIGSKRNAGTGQYGLDFYTNNINRLTITNNGNVGIGVTPQSKLHLGMSANRHIQFKDDLVPTLEVSSSTSGDGLAGIMRFRNNLEVHPSSDATRAGKIDVRNTAGIPTITLDGSTGKFTGNSVDVSVVNTTSVIAAGGIVGQTIYTPNLAAYGEKADDEIYAMWANGSNLDEVLLEATVTLPAAGNLLIIASVQGGMRRLSNAWPIPPASGTVEFKLDEYTISNTYISTCKKQILKLELATPTVQYLKVVNNPGQYRFKFKVYVNNAPTAGCIINSPMIQFYFTPNTLTVQ